MVSESGSYLTSVSMIDLDVDLANGLISYEEGFIKAIQLEDKLLEAAVELAVDLKKKLQAL